MSFSGPMRLVVVPGSKTKEVPTLTPSGRHTPAPTSTSTTAAPTPTTTAAPTPTGLVRIISPVQANARQQKAFQTDFFLSPVRRSARLAPAAKFATPTSEVMLQVLGSDVSDVCDVCDIYMRVCDVCDGVTYEVMLQVLGSDVCD